MDDTKALLRMENVSKSFPGVQALDEVSLMVHAGEIVGLIGENGAGKSTLMKILSGVYQGDSGQIFLQGQPAKIHDPHQAQELGISIIYQEFNLMPNLTVMENIYVGREVGAFGFINFRKLQRQTQELLDGLGINLRPTTIVRELSVAEQQMVEIAKALSMEVRVIIMDEPTSALSETEVQTLFSVMRGLKDSGIGIIFISHRLEEVLTICDRITILRDGKNVGELDAATSDEDQIIRLMVGRSRSTFFHKEGAPEVTAQVEAPAEKEVVLEVRGISRQVGRLESSATALDNISFELKRGEILGLAGLVGAGRTEVAQVIFGADRRDSGDILIAGQQVEIGSPIDAIKHGIGFVPGDRQQQGLVLSLAVRENIMLADLDQVTRFGFVKLGDERDRVQEYVDRLDIRTPSLDQRAINLSGGNQQKVVISKWLMLEPKILIMDEPTRGIDVGAKAEIYGLMDQLAQDGVGIIMISSELPELLAMSDRIVCMAAGRVTGTLTRDEATPERVMRYCTLTYDQVVAENKGAA
jgi:ABC-type sugar transport system ATPase subunit